jgi:hypothetical protein
MFTLWMRSLFKKAPSSFTPLNNYARHEWITLDQYKEVSNWLNDNIYELKDLIEKEKNLVSVIYVNSVV